MILPAPKFVVGLLIALPCAAGCARSPRVTGEPPASRVGIRALASAPAAAPRVVVLGTSVKGTPITMHVFGAGADTVLVFCAIHGDEPAAAFVGHKLLEYLQQNPCACDGRTVALVTAVNPDGLAAGTRTNANGVDCNRNFPSSTWKTRLWGRANAGARPASEPETLAVMRAIERVKPSRIVSIHSGLRCNNFDGPGEALAALLAKHNGYPVVGAVGYPTPGSFGSWAGGDLGLPVVTLELPRSNNGEKAWAENREGLLAVIRGSAETSVAGGATGVQK